MAMNVPGSNGGEEEIESVGGIFADINITPLTDIFLVLLIIFMVTTTAIAQSGNDEAGFKVNLPKGQKSEAGAVARDVTVAVLADGRAVVEGSVKDDAALRAAFEGARQKNPDTVVLFQADEGVAHGRVVQVMELARQAGLSRLAIATRADQNGNGR